MNARGLGPYGWMLCGSISFSFMAILSHAAREYCDWQVVVLARAGLVLLFAAGVAHAGKIKLTIWGTPVLWLRSFAGSASMMLTFYALTRQHVPTGYVLTLTNLFPIWVAILSWPVLGEMPPLVVWLAVASGVAGVVLIQDPNLPEGTIATWMALAASLCSAVAMLGLHQLRGIDPLAIVVHFSGVATVTALACCCFFDHPRALSATLGWQPLLILLGIGVTATIGQWFLTRAFTAGNPSRVSVIGLSQVVFVMVLEAIGGVPFTLSSFCGTVLVLAPTAWIMLQRKPAHGDTGKPLSIVTSAAVAAQEEPTTPKSTARAGEPTAATTKTDTPDPLGPALAP